MSAEGPLSFGQSDPSSGALRHLLPQGEKEFGPTLVGTVSGKLVDLLWPDWREIALGDIAHGLARIPRFLGQKHRTISVLEHSLAVGNMLTVNLRLAGLLHDAHEYLFGDLVTPVANALKSRGGFRTGNAIERIKSDLDLAICRRVVEDFAPAALEISAEVEAAALRDALHSPSVKLADARAYGLERKWTPESEEFYHGLEPHPGALEIRWLDLVSALARARFAGAVR